MVNIHLFHDASNLIAWETSPSVYSGIRHKALGYVLDRYVLAFLASFNLCVHEQRVKDVSHGTLRNAGGCILSPGSASCLPEFLDRSLHGTSSSVKFLILGNHSEVTRTAE